jgi:hypothetical protein
VAEPGDTLFLRESGEPVRVLAVLDGAGTLLVAVDAAGAEEAFQVGPDDVESALDRHRGCGCC